MRKKELLKIAPKEPSQKLISAAAGDRCEERCRGSFSAGERAIRRYRK